MSTRFGSLTTPTTSSPSLDGSSPTTEQTTQTSGIQSTGVKAPTTSLDSSMLTGRTGETTAPVTTQTSGIQSTGITAPTAGVAPVQQQQQVAQQSPTIQTGTQYGEIPNPAAQQQQDQQVQMSMQMGASAPPTLDPRDPNLWAWVFSPEGQEALANEGPIGIAADTLYGPLSSLLTGFTGLYQGLENQWNETMGSTPEASPYIANLLQNFQYTPGSLTQDVAQNWTNAMDAGAWEQRADNLMATQRENLLGALNDAERRTRGAAARGGYSPAMGLSNAYGNYSQGLTDAARNIYNDSLQQQMQALQGASSYALGSEAQDRALYADALQKMNQAAMFDAVQRADEHTNFGEFAGGVLGAGSAALGGMSEFASNLLGGLGGGGGALLSGLIPLL